MARRNEYLAALIAETGWSQTSAAAAMVRVAAESGVDELLTVKRSHIAMWIAGTQPRGRAGDILRETLSRRLKRPVTLAEIGLNGAAPERVAEFEWGTDTLTALADLGRNSMDHERRRLLAGAAYSVGGLALPNEPWWDEAPERARTRTVGTGHRVGEVEVRAVREMTEFFARRDQRHGGIDGRSALRQYIVDDVARYVGGAFSSEKVRRALYSAAAEAVYVVGWMGFDSSRHESARHHFTLALKLAAEADDAPLAGHVLRAMAHQAMDLRHGRAGLALATASVERKRYVDATPRERALIGIVRARALAVDGQRNKALAAIHQAETDLRQASSGDAEPHRVWFFQEASLAHQTAQALWALGDLDNALRHFRASVRHRRADSFSRTHAVTLGYMGTVEAKQGNIDAACQTWSRALDAMDGVQSGRTRDAAATMRAALSPFRSRGIPGALEVDARARAVLQRVT
ncbi:MULTISPECIES: Tat pathway signal protein [unclassified Streptomyces]|uniref:Tat pathway signal protein n=1 Tax=unclassified Streptomyces TaxID=2593676 RepID=UPI001CB72856|nr:MULTISPECIES: Tat pathway signal protein [unclassified Streptomyces]MBD0709851.1 Tat pathway signal protein [Streptomyces sp. CBMA291]MBD0715051.1 Tat pathway signal protein [Streptomyces sp. CBMA370]